MKPHTLFLPALGLGLLPFSGVRAQEALVGALQTDRVLQARAQPPAGKMIGPLGWSAAGTFRADWNDNIRLDATDLRSDFIFRPGLDLGLVWPISSRAVLSFGVGVEYAAFLEYDENNSLEISPDSAISLSVTAGDVVITVFNRLNYTAEVLSDPELTGRARYPRLENEAGARATWTIGDWQVQGGGTHANFWPLDDDFSHLERMSQQFFLRGAYLIAPGTRTGIETSASFTDYREDTRRDFNNLSAGPFVDWAIVQGLSATLRGGWVRANLSGNSQIPSDATLDSYYFGGSINHGLTEFIRHSLSVRHDLRVGLNAEFTESTSFAYDIRWQMTDVWDVSAGALYNIGKRPGGASGLDEDYNRYSFDIGIGRQIFGRLSGRLGYRYTSRESNFGSRDYAQNIVSLSLRYRF